MRQELCGLNSPDRVVNQPSEFLPLLFRDRGVQVLNLDQALANEYDLGDFGDARHPGIADQLGIQREQPVRLFRIPARRRLPLQKAALSVKFADGIDVGDKVVLSGDWSIELDLQIAGSRSNFVRRVVCVSEPRAGLLERVPGGIKRPGLVRKARPKSIAARVSFSKWPNSWRCPSVPVDRAEAFYRPDEMPLTRFTSLSVSTACPRVTFKHGSMRALAGALCLC